MTKRRVLLTGGSSGIGLATCARFVAAGDEVISLDIGPAPPGASRHLRCDLSQASDIDAALAELDERFDVLLNVAGVPGTVDPLLIMRVNILGLRHLTDGLLDRLNAGGAIVNIASVAGFNWQRRFADLCELLATPDFATGLAWCEARPTDGNDAYHLSKEAVVVYTMQLAGAALARGLRCNSVSPGPVDTPLLPAFREQAGHGQIDWVIDQIGRAASPDDIAAVVQFMASDAARFVNGRDLIVDSGLYAGLTTGWIDKRGAPLAKLRKR